MTLVYGPNLDISSNDLGGPLIADFYGEKAQYAQESDASLRINNFTHLILKVNSDEAQSDRIQLLLQAACLARLGSVVRQDPARPFIVSAISIDDILCAKWYFVYQPSASDAAVGLSCKRQFTTYVLAGRICG